MSAEESIAKEPVVFRKSGSGGHAKNTITGRLSALAHFNDFLKEKQLPLFDELSQSQLCNIELFQEYGTYLSEFARKKRKVCDDAFYFHPDVVISFTQYFCRMKCSRGELASNLLAGQKLKQRNDFQVILFGSTKTGIHVFESISKTQLQDDASRRGSQWKKSQSLLDVNLCYCLIKGAAPESHYRGRL
jgi:hypothetical protein